MRSLIKEFILIAILVSLGSGFSLVSGCASPDPTSGIAPGAIRVEDALPLNAIWIDSRERADFERDHISGAIWLTEDNWDDGLPELMEAWLVEPRPIIVYCSSASCGTSQRIADRLRAELDAAEIYTLHGGWDAWKP